jgi:hypothetical protein
MEMASIIPIMLILVFNFLALMIEVEGQNRAQSAISFAAEASLEPPVARPDLSCQYASRSFWSTVYAEPGAAGANFGCPGAPGAGAAPGSGPGGFGTNYGAPAGSVMTVYGVGGPPLTCGPAPGAAADYYNGSGYPPANPPRVRCTAYVKFNFSGSPLGAFVFWSPSWRVDGDASPTGNRQCDPGRTQCG